MNLNFPYITQSPMHLKFNERCEIVSGILRSCGIVPTRRANLNGHLHKLLSATIVTAQHWSDDSGVTLDIPTRKRSTWHEQGISTRFIDWFDKLEAENLLATRNNCYGDSEADDDGHPLAHGEYLIGSTIGERIT